MKKIPIQLFSEQWRSFRICIAECIIEIQKDLESTKVKDDVVYLKMIAALINEVLIKVDIVIAKQANKNTMSLSVPQALALHSAHSQLYLQSRDVYFTSLLLSKIIPTIDQAAA